jgi:predicted RNase H-like nuclease
MSETWTIVGVDCATQEERMGLARGTLSSDGLLSVERVTLGTAGESAAASVSQWLDESQQFVLALDAPLGWPASLGALLHQHHAGAALGTSPEQLFRRKTDRAVQRMLGKLPPEVGADRIARTAHATLALLAAVRAHTRRQVPLAFQQGHESGVIEVYPAATLITRGVSGVGYKAATGQGRKARAEILERLAKEADIRATRDVLIEDANLFDAVVCVLAGADFARGQCVEPSDLELARKEGYIWFRESAQRTLFAGR